MSMYYCTNCGESLDKQEGFDPSCGTWICTECGMLLMDDDVYEGDLYEGVAWFCDECEALLNRQEGFSDIFDTWICTECGNLNRITEEEIINIGDNENIDTTLICPNCQSSLCNQLYDLSYELDWQCPECGVKLHREYWNDQFDVIEETSNNNPECPNCGANLKDQCGYDEYLSDWNCKVCEALLHRDFFSDPYESIDIDDYEIEHPRCPNCGARLEEQPGFSTDDIEWECYECEACLCRDFMTDPFKVIDEEEYDEEEYDEEEYEEEWENESCDDLKEDDEHFDNNDTECDNADSNNPNYQNMLSSKRSLRQRRLKAFIFNHKRIKINIDQIDFVNMNINMAIVSLHNLAFKKIVPFALRDVCENSIYNIGDVESVEILDYPNFKKGDLIPYDKDVLIYFHDKKEIIIPFSDKNLKGKHLEDVVKDFQELGFINITKQPIYDLTSGLLKRNGSVEQVLIRNNPSFDKNERFAYDAAITIKFHTYKRRK